MKVVVTGGAGFLGQRLIGEVLQRGELTDSRGERHRVDEVVAVDPVGAPAQDRVRAMVGDVGDAAFIREAVRGADAMGFVRDGDFESVVRGYAKEYVR